MVLVWRGMRGTRENQRMSMSKAVLRVAVEQQAGNIAIEYLLHRHPEPFLPFEDGLFGDDIWYHLT